MLWDFSGSSIQNFDIESFTKVASVMRQYEKDRPSPKTALVVKNKIAAIAAKLYMIIVKKNRLKVKYKIFECKIEAAAWLADNVERSAHKKRA